MADTAPIPETELDAARMVRDGLLDPGYQFHNMWLWPLRISGVGVAWRSKDKSFCFRPPEHYLNDEFLARCNGLPVIFDHPEGATLNSEEYHDRSVGSIMLPYIKKDEHGEEPWGICRLYDEATNIILSTKPMSTSPCVDFARNENKSIILDSGKKCLVEGNPPLLDSLAICERGVWDKLGDPAGVGNGDESVTPEEEAAKVAADKAKADAEGVEKGKEATGSEEGMAGLHTKMNAIMDCLGATTAKMDSMSARMDAFEKKPDSNENHGEDGKFSETAAQKLEREEKEKAKKPDASPVDAKENTAEELRKLEAKANEHAKQAKADAEAMEKRLADAEKKLKEPDEKETEAMSDRQSKADSIYIQLGKRAAPPMRGETSTAYRLRIARDLQPHSATWKDSNLAALAAADANAFANAERHIYADAEAFARTPETKPGVLRMRQERSDTGHMINTFDGDISTWLQPPFRLRGKFKQNDKAA
jgi:hypothetical protein